MKGYASSKYAESLTEFGKPRLLQQSSGWILERKIPGVPYQDAIGCYPLFICNDWSKLQHDINELGDELISLSMVPDPFGDYDEAYLRECFKDKVVAFKQHYIVDMQRPIEDIVSRHHKKYALKGLEQVRTEVCQEPVKFLDEWMKLHQNLVNRHDIQGIQAHSRLAFEKQLKTPGIVVLKALLGSEIVGAQLWFQHNDVAFGHVLAFNETGYKVGATYALYWFALHYFRNKVRWCDIGGIAGMQDNDKNALSQFKEGWSTGRKTAYFCGRILNPTRYANLSEKSLHKSNFFPAYRNKL